MELYAENRRIKEEVPIPLLDLGPDEQGYCVVINKKIARLDTV